MPRGSGRTSAFVPWGTAQGQVLFHDGTNWKALAPGVAGQFLQTKGASNDPEWDSPTVGVTVAAKARLTSDQSINTGANSIIHLATEDYDLGNDFDTTSWVFTCPSDGLYLVCAAVKIVNLNDGDWGILYIDIDGGLQAYDRQMAAGTATLQLRMSDVLQLSATDTLKLYAYHNYGASRTVDASPGETYMSVAKIG